MSTPITPASLGSIIPEPQEDANYAVIRIDTVTFEVQDFMRMRAGCQLGMAVIDTIITMGNARIECLAR